MKPYEENSDATDMAPIPNATPSRRKLAEVANLDTNGVVVYTINGPYGPIHGWMHPETFREVVGEEAYQELLARPRVQSEFTEAELAEPDWDAIKKSEIEQEQK